VINQQELGLNLENEETRSKL